MVDVRTIRSLADIARDEWDALFPDAVEDYDYLRAVEDAGLTGFAWRYFLVEEHGRLRAAAPAFLTDYALETTLTPFGRKLAEQVRKVAPRILTLRLACIGSPCTETALIGFAPSVSEDGKRRLLGAILSAFEEDARDQHCDLLAVKDIPHEAEPFWPEVLSPRYCAVPGLPVAYLPVDFPNLDAYLARLSPGARRDMRRKLRAGREVRVEVRHEIDDVLDRVMDLYRQTRARAEMAFEDLTPEYFTGILSRMKSRASMHLYRVGDEILAANLLIHDGDVIVDKFFLMDADHGRKYNLYFLSWFNNIDACLSSGRSRYQAGQAAYANKLRLGSRLIQTSMYFRHRNRLVNAALRVAAPFLSMPSVTEPAR